MTTEVIVFLSVSILLTICGYVFKSERAPVLLTISSVFWALTCATSYGAVTGGAYFSSTMGWLGFISGINGVWMIWSGIIDPRNKSKEEIIEENTEEETESDSEVKKFMD